MVGKKTAKVFIMQIASFFYRGREGPYYRLLHDVDQKIPDWLIKIIFLGEDEIANRSGIKSRSGIMGFSTSDTILGLWFFFLTILMPPYLPPTPWPALEIKNTRKNYKEERRRELVNSSRLV